ncbi:MAG: DUF3089 domain-containing protein [Pseudomonadota bacterium]
MRKVLIGSATALLLLLFGLWLFGEDLLVAYVMPPPSFEADHQPAAPDYGQLDSWVSHPETRSAAQLLPAGEQPATTRVPVFYVHPTTYFGPGDWNADPRQTAHRSQGIEHMIATGASAFSACCEVYAPGYRQSHIAVFNRRAGDAGTQSLDLAYTDIERAFDAFLSAIGSSPFLLAGHSQGTLHLQRLLSQRVAGTPLKERLQAAYLIGYWLPPDLQPRNFPDVPYCEDAAQSGCVITWDSYRATGTGPAPDYELPIWYRGGWAWHNRSESVCVNPLSWRRDSAPVSAQAHRGALPTLPAGGTLDFILGRDPGVRYQALPDLLPRAAAARCDERGRLRVDPVPDAFADEGTTPEGSMHRYDWNLFYGNLRHNIALRLGTEPVAP